MSLSDIQNKVGKLNKKRLHSSLYYMMLLVCTTSYTFSYFLFHITSITVLIFAVAAILTVIFRIRMINCDKKYKIYKEIFDSEYLREKQREEEERQKQRNKWKEEEQRRRQAEQARYDEYFDEFFGKYRKEKQERDSRYESYRGGGYTNDYSNRNNQQSKSQNTTPKKSELEKALMLFKLSSDSTADQVKKKYRELAIQWHPDKFVNNTEANQKIAEKNFKLLNNAYNTLKTHYNIK